MWVPAVCNILLFVLQVFVCFKMLLTSGSDLPAQVDGCLMYVFNIQGFITHMVLYRSVPFHVSTLSVFRSVCGSLAWASMCCLGIAVTSA
jgi:hypothetical protein